ncbi:MAG: UDP-glucose 4-epimerase, partial [Gammaproteobacteria bacterium]|nr:UDP-glucose 4-epimerase [Gammaproteobacteria bacterium]
GTCKRDYIHITDLANGHIAAINWLLKNNHLIDLEVFNLGTGEATSVFEVIKTFEDVTKRKIPFKISSKRAGDLPQFWADSSKALEVLNWKPKYDIKKMIFDLWKWQSLNPNGYE